MMHEMALCEGILQSIEENARREGYQRVRMVRLEIGALAGVELDAMRFGFDAVVQGTLADGARLEIVEVPGQAWCMQCARAVPVSRRFDDCPRCGGIELEVTGGDAMRIKALEVE
jgi:hydrogenase nickel incorporation protein HypA/HybF